MDVANDLLSKCNLTLRLRTLGDCHAAVFIALYENILGETVPGKQKKVKSKIAKKKNKKDTKVFSFLNTTDALSDSSVAVVHFDVCVSCVRVVAQITLKCLAAKRTTPTMSSR